MKPHRAWIALVAALLIVAQPARAQSATGTVNLSGNVAPSCGVAASGGGANATQTVALGELSATNGTLRTEIENQFASSIAAISVVCNTVAPTIAISATPLSAVTTAFFQRTAFANTIAYTAMASLGTTGATPVVVSAASGSSASHMLSSADGHIANSAGNLVITATQFHTADPAQILIADASYKASIAVTIAPGI